MNTFGTIDWKCDFYKIIFRHAFSERRYSACRVLLSSLCGFLSWLGRDHGETGCYRWSCDAKPMGYKIAPLIAIKAHRINSRTSNSWPMEETYIKVNGQWVYYYRATDKFGKSLYFSLHYFGWGWGGAHDCKNLFITKLSWQLDL